MPDAAAAGPVPPAGPPAASFAANDLLRLLTLLQHGDSAFPSGAFGFSWGLEGMLADGLLRAEELPDAIAAMLENRWAGFDRVAVRRAWRAAAAAADGAPAPRSPEVVEALAALDAEVEAMLLAPAEREGSVRAGAALLATHRRLGTAGAAVLQAAIAGGALRGHRPVVEGALWHGLGLDEGGAALLSGYGFAMALCTAAVRLGRLGALGQQAIVTWLVPEIARAAAAPLPEPPELVAFNPLAEIAMMRQGLRHGALFAT